MSFLPDPPQGAFFTQMVSDWTDTVEGILEEPYEGFEDADEAANALLDAYEQAILAGGDPVGNSVISGNKAGALTLLIDAFGGNGFNTLVEFQTKMSNAFITYWVGATIGFAIPHIPGSTPVSNVIVSVPPIAFTIPYNPLSPPYPSTSFWINTLSTLLTTQIQGMTGLYSGVLSGSPVTLPWTGYFPSN